MKKHRLIIFVLLALFTTQGVLASSKKPPVATSQNIVLSLNGVEQKIPEDMGVPFLNKDTERTMVPIRFIAENLGSKVVYIPKDKKGNHGFILGQEELALGMIIGNPKVIYVNKDIEKVITLDAPAYVYDGRSYVPLRFISEAWGYEVSWNRDQKKKVDYINISTNSLKNKDKEDTSRAISLPNSY
ncbi:MAG: copper amine oxidase N-terminal domain-containing protein [Tissierellia bacterium]|nr:copper amine oxidase N-terminal domain-containing protein [Tissierellia bacterium]